MKITKLAVLSSVALAFLLTLAIDSNILAQGRGRGGGGRPTVNPSTTRTMGGGNVERGITTSSQRSNGRSDDGLGNASRNSNGRSDDGINRARTGGGNRNMPSDTELNRYRGISRKLGVSTETLRSRYETALASNPDLKFGQFVAANVIADNLSTRKPAITASAILNGLQNGDSIGETLKDLGINSDDAKRLEKEAKKQIKASKDLDD
ncbi:MAG TPA: hypothetical protein VNB22_04490 [Pyrinomonadaceae bacterium]|jgi:hypothetical protein|nr:hypothetical protein [Pyrinomonadaceae bacterium]